MLFQGRVAYRHCRFPAEALTTWKMAVKENRQRKKAGMPLLTFDEPWMPRSPYFIHCQQTHPYAIVPQQDTRFYTGWFTGQLDLSRSTLNAWIERYKILLPRERTKPSGAQGTGNVAICRLMEAYFPGKLAALRSLGRRLPFVGRNCSGIDAFNDPDIVTFDEVTKKWGFYEVKCENEIRRNQVHTNQAASLGFLQEFFGESADAAFVAVVEERSAALTPSPELLSYRFQLME